jgi:hypothetical protein
MRRLLFTQLTHDDLVSVVKLDDHGLRREPWNELARGELTEIQQRIVDYVTAGLEEFQPTLVNEATVWARAIFPLLMLAEAKGVQLQADVPLTARLGDVELAGCADGAFGTAFAGELRAPFVVIVEAKRGTEGSNPVTQLLGEMLAAACLSARETGRNRQQIHGCYTVADTWTFVRADVDGLDTERPTFSVVSSPEISEKSDAVRIVKILKSIVALHGHGDA